MTTAPHYRGVSYDSLYRRWTAHIQVNGKRLFLGAFDTPEAAAEANNIAAVRHRGVKSRLLSGLLPALPQAQIRGQTSVSIWYLGNLAMPSARAFNVTSP